MQRLLEREEARKEAVEERRRQQSAEDTGENATTFFAMLNAEAAQLNKDLSATQKGCDVAVFDALIARVRGLQAALTKATTYLAAYDVQKAQRDITQLEQAVRGRKARLIPRQEFSFDAVRKKQQLVAAVARADVVAVAVPVSAAAVAPAVRHTDETLHYTLEQMGTDFTVCDATRCVVRVAAGLFALKLARLSQCTVTCGAVQGSVFVDGCVDCTIELAGAAQLRIHSTQRCTFRIVVRSDPILEDSTALVFAPLPGHDGDGDGGGGHANHWANAKDFNCLGGVSPNFVNAPP